MNKPVYISKKEFKPFNRRVDFIMKKKRDKSFSSLVDRLVYEEAERLKNDL